MGLQRFFIGLCLFLFAFSSVANAQVSELPKPSLLPDHPLYFFSSITEQIAVFLTPGGAAKAKEDMHRASIRLAEMHGLLKKNKPSDILPVLSHYEDLVNGVITKAERETARGLEADQIIAILGENIFTQQAAFADVYVLAPDQIKPSLEKAMERSIDGYYTILDRLPPDRQNTAQAYTRKKKDAAISHIVSLREEGHEIPYLPLETASN